jgi:hypothetical protein
MPITINGSGTIGGINTGGLPDGCIATDDLANSAVTYAKLGTTEQSQVCKAWVNFNGSGVVSIRANYNVSSITDNGVGDYTVNFTTAMPDANYAATMSLAPNGYPSPTTVVTSLTAAALRFTSQGVSAGSGVSGDSATLSVAIFR